MNKSSPNINNFSYFNSFLPQIRSSIIVEEIEYHKKGFRFFIPFSLYEDRHGHILSDRFTYNWGARPLLTRQVPLKETALQRWHPEFIEKNHKESFLDSIFRQVQQHLLSSLLQNFCRKSHQFSLKYASNAQLFQTISHLSHKIQRNPVSTSCSFQMLL